MVLACAGCGTQETESTEQSDNFSAVDVYTVGEGTKSEVEEKKDDYEDAGQKEAGGEVAEFAGLIESRDAFMALGSDVIFTEERCAVIEAVDVTTLEETMAGIIMGDATPNIIFKSVDGKLGITGIN